MAGPYIERLPTYDLVYGYEYNRVVDALTNNRPSNTVAMLDTQAICFGYQPVDSVYKARCRFWIPPNVDTIVKIYLSFTLQPFHVGNQTTSSSTTSSAGSAHNHSVSGQTSGSTTSGNQSSDHVHVITLENANINNPVAYDGLAGLFSASGGGSVSTGFETGSNVHTHNVPSSSVSGATSTNESSHTHTIPSLSLTAPTAIYEAGMAQGVHAFLDGTDQTTPLGGPWGAGVAIDISNLNVTSYFTTVGWHEIQLSSTSIGGITTQLHFASLINGSI